MLLLLSIFAKYGYVIFDMGLKIYVCILFWYFGG